LVGRQRDEHAVVGRGEALALRLEHADDAEPAAVDADPRADGRLAAEEGARDLGAEDDDPAALLLVDLGESEALRDLERADLEVLGRDADHARRLVVLEVADLRRPRALGADGDDAWDAADGLCVAADEGVDRAGAYGAHLRPP